MNRSAAAVTFVQELDDADLRTLLTRAGRGDLEAFMAFYDATCDLVWRLELCRWPTRETAEAASSARFSVAWKRAGQQATSGLSPRAWLLGLPCVVACPDR